ncbi:hypothetical protein PP175_28960 (plasmid) [Aneurinibacillus sp. Ricciae_BoGa-3]|uniref:hypothetical protein n=1 Tax=Aneurinibacillus sp. Ricciae_BoGa-3 TaxID=3022697 RepID=UPI00233F8B16|nr:hypothetical protein [Aneurinibacillus sp. Ricciae_BoGa-3]WCK57222.1 hypothetical protein PP175_28960 [Aneurinibacillus sp. Ricciae_BoGa-3]
MFMMFVYVDGSPYHSMGIRGSLEELHQQAIEISQIIFKKKPKAEIKTKITKYI